MSMFVTASESSYFNNQLPTKFKVFIIMKTCRETMSAPRAFRRRPSLPKNPHLQILNSTSQYLPYLTFSTHFLQSPVYLNSLAVQRFTQVMPWKDTQPFVCSSGQRVHEYIESISNSVHPWNWMNPTIHRECAWIP